MESRYCSSTDFETLLVHWKHKHRQSVANTTQPTGTFWFCCLGEGRLSEKTVKYSHGVYTRSSRFGWLLRASTYSHVRNVVLSWTLSPVVWHLRNLKSWNSTFQTVCPVGGYCCAVFGKPKLSVMFRLHKQTQVVLFFFTPFWVFRNVPRVPVPVFVCVTEVFSLRWGKRKHVLRLENKTNLNGTCQSGKNVFVSLFVRLEGVVSVGVCTCVFKRKLVTRQVFGGCSLCSFAKPKRLCTHASTDLAPKQEPKGNPFCKPCRMQKQPKSAP